MGIYQGFGLVADFICSAELVLGDILCRMTKQMTAVTHWANRLRLGENGRLIMKEGTLL